jgi:GNAT superfamily N-acetyltransferase
MPLTPLAIPDLPPATRFVQMSDNAIDFARSFDIKKQAMGPHIAAKWGWDEDFQLAFHRERFGQVPLFRILEDEELIGTITFYREESWIRIGEFYLAPEFQNSGRGTRILRHCLALAKRQDRRVRLEYLKWNPVGSLYRREDFTEIGENEIHFFLEWRGA